MHKGVFEKGETACSECQEVSCQCHRVVTREGEYRRRQEHHSDMCDFLLTERYGKLNTDSFPTPLQRACFALSPMYE